MALGFNREDASAFLCSLLRLFRRNDIADQQESRDKINTMKAS